MREQFLEQVLDIIPNYWEGATVYAYQYDSHCAHILIDGVDVFFLKQADGTIKFGRS
jgi:hypothetical protein